MKRWDVLLELLEHRPHHRGAEIGVQAGRTTVRLLQGLPKLSMLYCVDMWKLYPDYEKDRVRPGDSWPSQTLLDKDELKFRRMAQEFGMRTLTMKMASVRAAGYVDDGSLDFVFIDANHLYEYVIEDIAAWRGKVRPGGLLIGHDYNYPTVAHEWGVKRAVDEVFGAQISLGEAYTWWVTL